MEVTVWALYAKQRPDGDFICSVVKFFLVHGNLYRKSGEPCSGRHVKSFRLCEQKFTRQMVGGLHCVCVILNLALRKVMPRGMAAFFREDARGANSSSESTPIPVCRCPSSECAAKLWRLPKLNYF